LGDFAFERGLPHSCGLRVTFFAGAKKVTKETPFRSERQLMNRYSGALRVHTLRAVPRTAQNARSQATLHASAK
jgi:hypothetical protein